LTASTRLGGFYEGFRCPEGFIAWERFKPFRIMDGAAAAMPFEAGVVRDAPGEAGSPTTFGPRDLTADPCPVLE
jgi:hypothetical protein